MDDATFIARLYKHGLLPGDLKELVSAHPTQRNKSAYFLDNAIKPSVMTGIGTSFSCLIKVMENSGYSNVMSLAEQIKSWLREDEVSTDNG